MQPQHQRRFELMEVTLITLARIFSVVAVALLLTSCRQSTGSGATGGPLPDHFGCFAVANGKLIELKKLTADNLASMIGDSTFDIVDSGDIINPGVPDDAYFVMYGDFSNPKLLRTTPATKDNTGRVHPEWNNRVHTEWEHEVRLLIAPVKGEQSMYRLKPAEPLVERVYMLAVEGCADDQWFGRCYVPVFVIHR